MKKPSAHDALIYLMIVVSASDRDMTSAEMARIGGIVRTWPVFEGFDEERILDAAKACQKLVEKGGLESVFEAVRAAVPERLHDTVYALAFEVASVDLEMRLEEYRVLQRLKGLLSLDADLAASIELAAKARSRSLT